MKNLILIAGMVLSMMTAGVCTAYSQSEDESKDQQWLEQLEEQEFTLTDETSAFKSCVVSIMKQARDEGKKLEDFAYTEEQLKVLKEKSLAMFKSHGFTEKHVMDLVENNDERLVFVATVFTAIVEAKSVQQ